MRNLSLILAGLLLLGGCAKPKQDDPLKNTKKLVVKGHVGLYENGAFQVPHTSFKLIPAGPEPMELAQELVGIRATESFDKAIHEAKESVYIIPEGSKYSLKLAEAVYGTMSDAGDSVTGTTRQAGTWIIDKSARHAVDTILGAPESGMEAGKATYEYGDRLESDIYVNAEEYLASSSQSSGETMDATLKTSGAISDDTARGASEKFDWAAETFIVGYTTLPDKLATRGSNIADAADGEKFATAFDEAWDIREEHSVYFADLFGSAISDYGDHVGESMEKAKRAFVDNYEDEGVIFASLKSMRWALHSAATHSGCRRFLHNGHNRKPATVLRSTSTPEEEGGRYAKENGVRVDYGFCTGAAARCRRQNDHPDGRRDSSPGLSHHPG